MNRWLSGKQVAVAVAASAGLMFVLCLGLVTVLLVAGVGDGRKKARLTVAAVDRIAFVGTGGDLYLMDRNGESVEYLAVGGDGAALAFPTWSPDGKRVAFIAQRQASTGVESILYTVSTVGGKPATLYSSVENPAFYIYWSTDSQYVSFLTQEFSGLALRLAPADGSQDARILERGSPFYWSWSPDSQEMLMHIGGARSLSEQARLAILAGQPDSMPNVLEDAPANFQAPAWSPDGDQLLYAGEEKNGEQALYLRQHGSGAVEKLVNVSGLVRFNWSPDGKWIAYQQIDNPRMAPLGQVFLVSADLQLSDGGVSPKEVSRDPVVAFFWSPDSQRLALLVPSLDAEEPSTRHLGQAAPMLQERQLMLRWWLVDVSEGEPRPLVAFRPTRSFLAVIPYFDQYAQSIRFWSPDSRYLVYSDQESSQRAGIWIADVEGQETPQRLNDGTIAVWSWQ